MLLDLHVYIFKLGGWGMKHQKLPRIWLRAVSAGSDPARCLNTCSTQHTGMSSLTLLGQVCWVCNIL